MGSGNKSWPPGVSRPPGLAEHPVVPSNIEDGTSLNDAPSPPNCGSIRRGRNRHPFGGMWVWKILKNPIPMDSVENLSGLVAIRAPGPAERAVAVLLRLKGNLGRNGLQFMWDDSPEAASSPFLWEMLALDIL